MELIKKQIHMNRWKGNVTTQLTLDDDFIVPDALDDMERVMLDTGEVQVESLKNQGDRVAVKGKLEFRVLYSREGGGLQTLGGSLPFEELVNVPGLEEKDYIGLNWMLEDLRAEMINSRKLGVRAIVTLQVRVEALRGVEAAVAVSLEGAEIRKHKISAAAIAVRRKDTCRVRGELGLTGGKPNIDRLLWRELRLHGVNLRPLDGRLHLEGELGIFVLYDAEEEGMPVQWLEETLPFMDDLEMADVREGMIPMVGVRLAHREIEPRPDGDGELRLLEADAVLELEIKLYEEQEIELLNDLYSNRCEVELERDEACFDRILARNVCKTKVAEKFSLPQAGRILQICHNEGIVKIDEVEVGEDSLQIDGVLEVTLLYMTSDDACPVQSSVEQIPFRCAAEARGIGADSVYQLDAGLEQLGAVMLGGDTAEVRAVVALDFLVLQPEQEPVITAAAEKPLNTGRLEALPGIVGYIVQPGESLWDIAKRFCTTVGEIIAANGLSGEAVEAGQRLLLVKEVERPV